MLWSPQLLEVILSSSICFLLSLFLILFLTLILSILILPFGPPSTLPVFLFAILSIYLSVALSLSLCLPVCLSVYHSVILSVCLSIFTSQFPPEELEISCNFKRAEFALTSTDQYLSDGAYIYPPPMKTQQGDFCLSICLSVCLSQSVYLCLSLSVRLSLSLCSSVSLSLFVSLCLCVCLSLSLSLSPNILCLPLFFSYSIFFLCWFLNLDSVVHAIDRVISGRNKNAFCLVRPPGCTAGTLHYMIW